MAVLGLWDRNTGDALIVCHRVRPTLSTRRCCNKLASQGFPRHVKTLLANWIPRGAVPREQKGITLALFRLYDSTCSSDRSCAVAVGSGSQACFALPLPLLKPEETFQPDKIILKNLPIDHLGQTSIGIGLRTRVWSLGRLKA